MTSRLTGRQSRLSAFPGSMIQIANVQTGATSTGSTLIPSDDTIPQNTEGDEVITLTITPKASGNALIIEVVVMMSSATAGTQAVAALFQDSTANALAVMVGDADSANALTIAFKHKMTAGITSATTFKVRIGQTTAGTLRFNGVSGARLFGGVAASSITIIEVVA